MPDLANGKQTKKVNGVSIEKALPKKWIDHYKGSKWYKEVVGGKHRFA